MAQNILVLEDDQHLRDVLVATLEDEGYEVVGASSADEALRLAETRKFPLLLTDVRLPGMDGLAFLLEMRRRQPTVRAIVITGYADEDAPSRAILARADDYIYKPFKLMALLSAVSRLLNPPEEKLLADFNPRKETGWMELGRIRDRVFRGFFVGVRSAMLDAVAARRLWNRLEMLEEQREALWHQLEQAFEPAGERRQSSEIPDCAALIKAYEALLQTLTGSVQVDQPRDQKQARLLESLAEIVGTRPDARQPNPVSAPAFERLYQRVRGGQISPERLIVAASLRRLSPERLQESPELGEAYRSVWAE